MSGLSERSSLPRGGVLHRHRHLCVGRTARFGGRDDPHRAFDGDALANEATGQCAVSSVDELGLASAFEVERELVGGHAVRGDDKRRQVDHVVDRLVPLHMGRPVHVEGLSRPERRPGGGDHVPAQVGFDTTALCLQAPDAHAEKGALGWAVEVDEAFRPGRPALGPVPLAVGPWGQHAPLEAHLVLAGGRPIRVQDIALVEDGVSHGPRRLEAVLHGLGRHLGASRVGGAHAPPSFASLRSCAKAWSQVGRPRIARKR